MEKNIKDILKTKDIKDKVCIRHILCYFQKILQSHGFNKTYNYLKHVAIVICPFTWYCACKQHCGERNAPGFPSAASKRDKPPEFGASTGQEKSETDKYHMMSLIWGI